MRVHAQLLAGVYGHRVVQVAVHLLCHLPGDVGLDALVDVHLGELAGLRDRVGDDLAAFLLDLVLREL